MKDRANHHSVSNPCCTICRFKSAMIQVINFETLRSVGESSDSAVYCRFGVLSTLEPYEKNNIVGVGIYGIKTVLTRTVRLFL